MQRGQPKGPLLLISCVMWMTMLASASAAADVVTLRVLLPPGGLVAGSSIDPAHANLTVVAFATASAAASAGASSATPLLRSVIVNVSTTVALASHNGELIHPQSVVLTNGVGVVSRLEFDPSKCTRPGVQRTMLTHLAR